MKKIVVLPSFERSFNKLSAQEKKLTTESLKRFNFMLVSKKIFVGLGFKKINHDKYELRVNIRLRVIIKSEKDAYYLVLVGSHDEVRKYLRNYR